jgi:hypothetical protein
MSERLDKQMGGCGLNFNPKSCLVCFTVGEPEQFAHPQNPKLALSEAEVSKIQNPKFLK